MPSGGSRARRVRLPVPNPATGASGPNCPNTTRALRLSSTNPVTRRTAAAFTGACGPGAGAEEEEEEEDEGTARGGG